MSKLLLINGPNLNLLGTREPDVYGNTDLKEVEKSLKETATKLNHTLECFQSNAEHAIVDRIQKAAKDKI